MLNPDAHYRITRLDPPGRGPANAGQLAPMHHRLRAGQAVPAHGAWLVHAGLPLPRMAGESVQLYRFEAQQ